MCFLFSPVHAVSSLSWALCCISPNYFFKEPPTQVYIKEVEIKHEKVFSALTIPPDSSLSPDEPPLFLFSLPSSFLIFSYLALPPTFSFLLLISGRAYHLSPCLIWACLNYALEGGGHLSHLPPHPARSYQSIFLHSFIKGTFASGF